MKKIILVLFAVIFASGIFSGCENISIQSDNSARVPVIVTTIFPEYDWVMNILGDNPADAEVIMLLDNGVDLHSFQPSAEDILKISNCDLFIYVGGESDEWVDDALAEAVNKEMIVLNLLDILGNGAKEEELVEGMQPEDEAEGKGEEEIEFDEHVWLSLKNAEIFINEISRAIQLADPDNSKLYITNADKYSQQVQSLDQQYAEAVSGTNQKTLLFGDRFPFRYLVDDYGLSYYAAFAGCSAETEASFETISFLSNKIDELGLEYVMTIEGTDHRIAETIIQNTQLKNQKILSLDSMQSTTIKDVLNGAEYLQIMKKNLDILSMALGKSE